MEPSAPRWVWVDPSETRLGLISTQCPSMGLRGTQCPFRPRTASHGASHGASPRACVEFQIPGEPRQGVRDQSAPKPCVTDPFRPLNARCFIIIIIIRDYFLFYFYFSLFTFFLVLLACFVSKNQDCCLSCRFLVLSSSCCLCFEASRWPPRFFDLKIIKVKHFISVH